MAMDTPRMDGHHPYHEDGAHANEAEEDDGENAVVRTQWPFSNWVLVGVGAVAVGVIVAGGIAVYYLYKRVQRLEDAPARTARKLNVLGN